MRDRDTAGPELGAEVAILRKGGCGRDGVADAGQAGAADTRLENPPAPIGCFPDDATVIEDRRTGRRLARVATDYEPDNESGLRGNGCRGRER